MSEIKNSFNRRQSNQVFLFIVVVAVATLAVALYKINRTQEQIKHSNTETIQSIEVKREDAAEAVESKESNLEPETN